MNAPDQSIANESTADQVNTLDNSLDPREVHDQTAALAGHLQRSGIQFLPQPTSAGIEHWQTRWAVPEPQSAASSTPNPTPPAAVAESPPPRPKPPATPVATPSLIPTAAAETYPGDPLPIAERQQRLGAESDRAAACTKCPILAECRTNVVYGEGNVQPRFVFFGEGPGADEDASGRPFVGRAGALLDKMIVACNLRREDTYILNSVKCRPPGNRNPQPDELANCREYFETQFEILRAEYIICLGAISAQTLLETKQAVGKLRGKFHNYRGSKVLVTYHPAYLLRTPKAKSAAWTDLKMLMAEAGL